MEGYRQRCLKRSLPGRQLLANAAMALSAALRCRSRELACDPVCPKASVHIQGFLPGRPYPKANLEDQKTFSPLGLGHDRRSGSRRIRCRGAGGLDYTWSSGFAIFLGSRESFLAITTVAQPDIGQPFYASG